MAAAHGTEPLAPCTCSWSGHQSLVDNGLSCSSSDVGGHKQAARGGCNGCRAAGTPWQQLHAHGSAVAISSPWSCRKQKIEDPAVNQRLTNFDRIFTGAQLETATVLLSWSRTPASHRMDLGGASVQVRSKLTHPVPVLFIKQKC